MFDYNYLIKLLGGVFAWIMQVVPFYFYLQSADKRNFSVNPFAFIIRLDPIIYGVQFRDFFNSHNY